MVGFCHGKSRRGRAYGFLLFICWFFLAPGVRADADSHRVNVEQLILLLDLKTQTNKVLQTIPSAFSAQMQKAELPVEYTGAVSEYQEKVTALIEASIGWDVLQPLYVSHYAELFSEQELLEILTFLRSPTGWGFLESSRNVSTEMDSYIKAGMAGIQPELEELSTALRLQVAAIQQSQIPDVPDVPDVSESEQ